MNAKTPAKLEAFASEEKLKKICYKFLFEIFQTGTKVNRFDAEISEYWSPHIEYDVVPRMMEALRGSDRLKGKPDPEER